MQSTCSKECHLWKKYKDSCPNYIVGYWKESGSSTEVRIEDCAPKRILEQLKVIHNLLIGLHQASNEERNSSDALVGVMAEVVKRAQEGRILINGFDTEEATLPATKS